MPKNGFSQKQKLLILLGLVSLLLIAGWLLLKPEPASRSSPPGTAPLNEEQLKEAREEERSRVAAGQTIVSPQAYAMVPPVRQQLIGVTTGTVERRPLETTVRAVGRVEYDERRITHVNLRISGWIEDLFVNYTGQLVRKGQPLFTLYSPELVATQDEYLLALHTRDTLKQSPLPEVREQAEQLVESARERLRLWTLTNEQLAEIARRRKAQTSLTMAAPATGYVFTKTVFKGMFVEPEQTLYSIADLSRVWMNVEIYEYELPFVQVGQPATVTMTAYPGETFHGRVSYMYPYLNPETRTATVRLELPNPKLRLKPEMYGTVQIRSHRGVQLALPEGALLDSGARQLVFVVRGEGLFEPREVKVGPKIGAYYEVQDGLQAGDRVVTSGTFLIDSESQLMAATNMMGSLGMGGVKMEQAQMGAMDMEGKAPSARTALSKAPQEQRVDGLTIRLATEPAPPRVGENRIRVEVTEASGKKLTRLPVALTYTMPMPAMLPATVRVRPANDHYAATVNLGMAGQWDLTVTVERPDRSSVQATFAVQAGGAGVSRMPGM